MNGLIRVANNLSDVRSGAQFGGAVATIGCMSRIGTVLLALVAFSAVILIAFGLSSVPIETEPEVITGQVVSVEQGSVTTILRMTLEDESGKQWTFEGGGDFAGFTPSHLEEHRALGEQVTVEYETTAGGILKILSVSD